MIDATAPTDAARLTQRLETRQEAEALSDFDDFLKLLTAQLRNQNPLEPMDSTQFVEQLASFASVEQQVGSNARLDALLAQGQAADLAAMGQWVGREVVADAALFAAGADGLVLPIEPRPAASEAEAVIADAAGREVARLPLDPTADTLAWDGAAQDAGPWSVTLHHRYEDAPATELRLGAEGRVVEVRRDADRSLLRLESGALVEAADVTALVATEE